MPPTVICVEGIIAAGKTEFCRMLAAELPGRTTLVLEPVKRWVDSGALAQFYQDPQRWAYAFQTFAYSTRVQDICDKWDPAADYIVIERSPLSDLIFFTLQAQDGNVTQLEQDMYKTWCCLHDSLLAQRLGPRGMNGVHTVYLRPQMGTCMNRLTTRARGAEVGVREDYQTRLLAMHDQLIDERPLVYRVPPADLEPDYRTDAGARRRLVAGLLTYLAGDIDQQPSSENSD